MHQLRVISWLLALVFLVGGCGPSLLVGQSHQSSCREGTDQELPLSPEVVLQVEGRHLTVLHRNALTNCCLTTAMEVKVDGTSITVWEREQPGEACRCLCPRELSVTIYYLALGMYTVQLYRDDEPEPFWKGQVRIQ